MASQEDREHNRQLLKLSRARLRIREEQALKLGDTADPSVQLDIEQLRIDIAALEQITSAPEPSAAVAEAIDRHLDGNIQFLFVQMLKIAQRMTHSEEQITQISQAQHAAQLDRLATREALERNDQERKGGQLLNRALLFSILGIAICGFAVLLLWLDGRPVIAGVIGYLLLSLFVGAALGRYLKYRSGG